MNGIKTKSEMADDLIIIWFILIFFNKIRSAGEGDPIDIFFHLIRSHTDTIINKFQGLFPRDSQ